MEFLKKFAAFPRKKQIAIVVWSAHFLIVFCLALNHLVSRAAPKRRPILVKTFEVSTPKSIAKTSKPASPSKKQAKASPPIAKAAPKAKPSPAPQKQVPKPAENSELLEEIAKGLDAIGKAEPLKRRALSLPSKIEPLAELSEESKSFPEYADFLITYLQHSLDLPEHGDVKAEIRIDRFGHLVECIILNAQSRKNADFLKKRLPELTFPCFNDFSIDDIALSFTITFRNVEIR